MDIKERAKLFAINAHYGQVRKSEIDKPMIIHPINVANILNEYSFDDNVIAAGYLHDVVEDTKYNDEDILKEFGEDILSLVMGDSEPDKKLSWEERKQYTIDKVKTLDIRHKAVVCADKISNLEDLQILFEKIKNGLNYKESNEKQCWQPNLESPTKKSEFRDVFWKDYHREGIRYIMKKYGIVPLRTKVKNKLLIFMGGGTQKVTSIMLITPKGGQHNELEAA